MENDASATVTESSDSIAVELTGITKRFGAVLANNEISIQIPRATIYGIVGENGAGKSTLMQILFGFYQADSGTMRVHGKQQRIRSTQDAIDAGIGMVHQHFMLVDNFTVLENIVLGAESGPLLKASLRRARETLQELEREYGLEVDVDALVSDLPVGLQQRVEILKALYRNASVLILDEPTGVLTPQETDQLFRILAALKQRGVTVILITHKLREIVAITDSVSVMRNGSMVAHHKTENTSEAELAELMVGRKVLLNVNKSPAKPGAAVLRVDKVSLRDERGVSVLKGVSFNIHAGEIVGIAGVTGNGQTELLQVLSGARALSGGSVTLGDQIIQSDSTYSDAAAVKALGVGHVPEDRLLHGMIGSFSAAETSILGYQTDALYTGALLTRPAQIAADCLRKMQKFDVRPPEPKLQSSHFSGGNQQKLVLAREMDKQPQLLLVGQPTRGVDIGAIEFIHQEIVDMRDRGAAVLLVSVELEEIMSVADRIVVMFDGAIVGTMAAADANESQLGQMMANTAAV